MNQVGLDLDYIFLYLSRPIEYILARLLYISLGKFPLHLSCNLFGANLYSYSPIIEKSETMDSSRAKPSVDDELSHILLTELLA